MKRVYFDDQFDRWWTLDTSSGCWNWNGRLRKHGYGVWKQQQAHRVSYERTNGPIPAGLCVCHRCDNTRCVNPAHLFVGTQAENIADMRAKGRDNKSGPGLRGERVATSKLTHEGVIEIKTLLRAGVTQTEIGKKFCVTQAAISLIANGIRWRHV